MKDYQLNIYGEWIPIENIIKNERLDKNYKIKFKNWLKKESDKNVSKKVK